MNSVNLKKKRTHFRGYSSVDYAFDLNRLESIPDRGKKIFIFSISISELFFLKCELEHDDQG
jgi:hypothetical protein